MSFDQDDRKILYMAEFTDGYSFRQLIDYLKTILTTEATLIFTQTEIKLRKSDSCFRTLNDIVIRGEDLGRYEYYSDLEEEIFGFDLGRLKTTTSTIGKKDGFRIWKYENNEKLFMQKISQKKNSTTNSYDFILNKLVPVEEFELPEYDTAHNCNITASEFSEMCKSMTSIKCKNVVAIGFHRSIIFKAITDTEIIGRHVQFGDPNVKQGEEKTFDPNYKPGSLDVDWDTSNEICRVQIVTSTIKALVKINNFSSGINNLQIYVKKDNPICIRARIGNFGIINIYLRDENTGR
jgi:hypothetical protein